MCGYTGSHFGASYEDAACIDGYLWDLDSGDEDGLSNGGDLPCPACNTAYYLDDAKEDAESTSWGSSMLNLYSGAMIIEAAISRASKANGAATAAWKKKNPKIRTFDWPDRAGVLAGRVSAETISETTITL